MKTSVCIATYNQADYLEKAVRSAVEQTVCPIEIIVSNDCSTDKTVEILDQLAREISILKIVHQKKNLGIIQNANSCLRIAKGDYIVRLDSDDYLFPDFVEKLLREISKYDAAAYAHGAVQEINENGEFTRIRRLWRKTGYVDDKSALIAAVNGYKVAANIVMFRRTALQKVGFLQSETNFVEDYYLSAALAAAGYGNVYRDEILSCYRVTSGADRFRQKRNITEITGIREVFEKVLEPAFESRRWDKNKLLKARKRFACTHANCFASSNFNKEEKVQAVTELYKLSPMAIVKVYIFLYQKNLGLILQLPSKMKALLKRILKH